MSATHSLHHIFQTYRSSLAPEDLLLLLEHSTKQSKEYLIAHPEFTLTHHQYQSLRTYIRRRQHAEPIALIRGTKEFYGFPFFVNRHTLIPRPETELLVESVLKTISVSSLPITFIDVGTGSGCILLSIAKHLETMSLPSQHVSCFGLDISTDALTVARRNRRRLHPVIPVRFLQSDLLAQLPQRTFSHAKRLIITANLPYLSDTIYHACPPDVKQYEPETALRSDMDGLAHILRLLHQITHLHALYPTLPLDLWIEISPEQKIPLTRILRTTFPHSSFTTYRDLTQRYRYIALHLST